MQVRFTIIVHVHTTVWMSVQIASQDNILLDRWQVCAWLVACAMYMYGLVLMVYRYTVMTECV